MGVRVLLPHRRPVRRRPGGRGGWGWWCWTLGQELWVGPHPCGRGSRTAAARPRRSEADRPQNCGPPPPPQPRRLRRPARTARCLRRRWPHRCGPPSPGECGRGSGWSAAGCRPGGARPRTAPRPTSSFIARSTVSTDCFRSRRASVTGPASAPPRTGRSAAARRTTESRSPRSAHPAPTRERSRTGHRHPAPARRQQRRGWWSGQPRRTTQRSFRGRPGRRPRSHCASRRHSTNPSWADQLDSHRGVKPQVMAPDRHQTDQAAQPQLGLLIRGFGVRAPGGAPADVLLRLMLDRSASGDALQCFG